MLEASQAQLAATLKELGLQPGMGVLAHSALHYFGRLPDGAATVYRALAEVLDLPQPDAPTAALPTGTLCVPAFSFSFARGAAFDPAESPSEGMGIFSEYVRRLPFARRTPHPLQSLAIVGKHAAGLAERVTPCAFDPGSAFERLVELDSWLLLLGASVQAASIIHYSEQRAGVPYRYWKDFSGQVHTGQGWETQTWRMFVRDLDLDPRLVIAPVQRLLEQRGQWRTQPLNYGQVAACRLGDFVAAADDLLAEDPWVLVENRPV